MEIQQSMSIKPKITGYILGSGNNVWGALQQKGIKQGTDVFWFITTTLQLINSGTISGFDCVYIYRVSQEECARLRESVPYVKIYRYNPKHLYPKLNGYGYNGHWKVWASGGSTFCMPSMTPYLSTAHAWQRDIVMQWHWWMLYSTVALTSQDNSQLHKVLGNLRTNTTVVRVFL